MKTWHCPAAKRRKNAAHAQAVSQASGKINNPRRGDRASCAFFATKCRVPHFCRVFCGKVGFFDKATPKDANRANHTSKHVPRNARFFPPDPSIRPLCSSSTTRAGTKTTALIPHPFTILIPARHYLEFCPALTSHMAAPPHRRRRQHKFWVSRSRNCTTLCPSRASFPHRLGFSGFCSIA
jgi:hypothetical protein